MSNGTLCTATGTALATPQMPQPATGAAARRT